MCLFVMLLFSLTCIVACGWCSCLAVFLRCLVGVAVIAVIAWMVAGYLCWLTRFLGWCYACVCFVGGLQLWVDSGGVLLS